MPNTRVKGRTPAETRKLNNMLADLAVMKAELLPDEKDKKREEELKSFDDFQRKKHDLNSLLQRIRVDVDRLNDLRKKLSGDERDTTTIRLSADNTANLKEALEKFNELKTQLTKDEKKKGKKKLDEQQLQDRRQMVILLGEQIKDLTNENARTKTITNEEEQAIQARVDRRKQREAEQRERRAAAKRNRKGKKGDPEDEEEYKVTGPQSEQEQAFEQKVNENMEEQDKMLMEISAGLDELKELATEANKQLTIQKAMLDQVDEKMDSTIKGFKTANQRLKTMLDESGGMSRWCPMMICGIVLLALIGYIFNIA